MQVVFNMKIQDQFDGKIRNDDISKFESGFELILPDSYKSFLLKNNGGRPVPNGFKSLKNEINSQVQFLFGMTSDNNYDLIQNYNSWKNKNDYKKFMPIAIDVTGNLLVIDLSNNGNILLWIHDSFESEFVFIAGAFDKFLAGLLKVDVESSEIDLAIDRQDIRYFEKRIIAGEDINNFVNDFNQKVVFIAALKNKVRLLKFFYSKGASMKLALFNAASNGHFEAVKYLLSLELDVNERDITQNNDTPLIQAAFGGYLDIVKELIKAGAELQAKDSNNQSVLRKAYWSNNDELISYLENLGAQA